MSALQNLIDAMETTAQQVAHEAAHRGGLSEKVAKRFESLTEAVETLRSLPQPARWLAILSCTWRIRRFRSKLLMSACRRPLISFHPSITAEKGF